MLRLDILPTLVGFLIFSLGLIKNKIMTKGMKSLLEHAFCGHVVQSLHLTKKERISSRTKCKSRCIYIVLPQTISDQLYCFSLWRRHRAWRILSWNLVCVYCTRPLCQPWTWSIRTTVLKIISNYWENVRDILNDFPFLFPDEGVETQQWTLPGLIGQSTRWAYY